MKKLLPVFLVLASIAFSPLVNAAVYKLTPLPNFGSHSDGSVRPTDSPPQNTASSALFDSGFNQRGLAVDPITTNLVIVDTHSGAGGSTFFQGGIYILKGDTGDNVQDTNLFLPFTLPSTGISGGSYADAPAVVADDGVVYVANQVIASSVPLTIYRWPNCTDTNPPVVAFSATISPVQRLGVTMDVRGATNNTQIIMGSFNLTNVIVFTTTDGTNFTANVLTNAADPFYSGIEGVCWGAGDTFWAKSIGGNLRWLSVNVAAGTFTTTKTYTPAQLPNSDFFGPIAVDTNRNLLAAIEEKGGLVNTGPERIWLYDISDVNNLSLLDVKDYVPDNQNATAPQGYVRFSNGRLYANVVNNGLLGYSVDSAPLQPPSIANAPAPTNRVVLGQSVGLTVQAYPNVGYTWKSNNVDIPGATSPTLALNNVQASWAANYSCLVTNLGGSISVTSRLEVVVLSDLYHLNLMWSARVDTVPFITGAARGGTPDQRMIAYNALSNHLYIISRSSNTTSNYTFHVLNATNGNILYTMKTNGILLGVGQGGIGLAGLGVADDGAIYAGNIANNANGGSPFDDTKQFRIYRWANAGPNTYPSNIFTGDPSLAPGNTTQQRWGDSFTVRGSGVNTEILLDASTTTGTGNPFRNVAIIRPTDGTMQNWASQFMIGTNASHSASTVIGHAIQFDGGNQVFWQKQATAPMTRTSYDPTSVILSGPPPWISDTTLNTYGNFSNRLCSVGLDLTRHLAAGVIIPSTAVADSLALYDITSPDSPLLIAQYNFPVTPHNADANFITHTIFAGTNLCFSLDPDNGILAFTVASGPLSAPSFVTQPASMRLILGGSGTMTAATLETALLQWQKDAGTGFTNVPSATTGAYAITNAQFLDAGSYRVVATNDFSGSRTSSVAIVTVASPVTNYSVSTLWSVTPAAGNGNVINSGGAGVPNQRSFGYSAAYNHLYVPSRLSPGSISNYVVYVLDATTGAVVSTLSTNGLYNAGAVGEGGVGLVCIGASDDGSIYACNMAPDACACGVGATADSLFRVYRWSNEGATLTQVFSGDPGGSITPARWGDAMTVRGSGINTEILLDSNQGSLAAILKPSDATLTTFTNAAINTTAQGPLTIGRSLQYSGATNAFWQKRAQSSLRLSSYSLPDHSSSTVAAYGGFPIGMAAVGMDFGRNLLVGVETNGLGAADCATLIETSDLNTPMVIARFAFPTTGQSNPNCISHVEWAGSTVWAFDANNGLMALTLAPKLNIGALNAGKIPYSWTTNAAGFTLQATPSLSPPVTWTNVGIGTIVGDQYWITNTTGAEDLFYRLKH